MNSVKSQRDDRQPARELALRPLGWPPSGLFGAIAFATQCLFILASLAWIAGLLGFLGDDIERLFFWIMAGSVACSVLARIPEHFPAARERARDIAYLLESASPRLEGLIAEISERTAALADLDQEIRDRKDDLDDTIRELEVHRRAVLENVDQVTEVHSEIVQQLKDIQKSGNRSAWRFFWMGILASIPVGVFVNVLTK
jgi:hypothetical protein